MKKLMAFSIILLLVAGIAPINASDEPGAVIVHVDNPISQLNIAEIKNIYRGKRARWRVLDLPANDPFREQFFLTFFDKNNNEINRYYLVRAISGKGRSPEVIETTAEIKSIVAADEDAIGFILLSEVDDSVKVIFEF